MPEWFRYTTLPPWPGKPTPSYARRHSPFKAAKDTTLRELREEINYLVAETPADARRWHHDGHTEIAINVPPHALRKDGGIIERFSLNGPEVIVSFNTHDSGRLVFPCDTYTDHKANLRAITLTLEKLRAIERYGAMQGRQYTGFKALPASTTPVLTTQQAAEAIAKRVVGTDVERILKDWNLARNAIRFALAATHPDTDGGSTADFQLVGEARRILSAHHGTTL